LEKIIECANEFIAVKEDSASIRRQFNGIKNTNAGQAYLAVEKTKSELTALKKKHDQLQQDLTAAKLDKASVEKLKKSVEDELNIKKQELMFERQRLARVSDEELRLKQENQKLKQDCIKKDQDLLNQQQKAKVDLSDLQVQLNSMRLKAEKVDQLESQIKKTQLAQTHYPEVVKLSAQLGPIPPKYQARPQDKEVQGAMDIDDIEDIDPIDEAFFKEYNKRYGEARTAPEVAIASFNYACEQLLDMAEKGDKIKLTNSGDTSSTLGMYAVYRYMALDLIKGGKVAGNGCHGYKFSINDNISMLPSKSERILQFKPDVVSGLKPIVEVHYRQRDDFTPDEEALGLRDGVDAVSAKWILEQLTDEEMGYLFTHLMAPVIENNHPDYVNMRQFMQKKGPRAKLVETASELIQDIATAFQKKFANSVLVPSYNDHFDDWDIEAFVKKEDNQDGLQKIANDLAEVSTGPKIVDWELDADVIGDKRQYDYKIRQQDFYNLISASRKEYQSVLAHMGPSLLRHPLKPGQEFKKLVWDDVNKQYHVAHQMIGADFNGDGGERCLFSNLLAILVTDKDQLTSQNVQKLKNAMANYLDKLQKAAAQWSVEKNKLLHLQTKDANKMKELAELHKAFEQAIRKTHNCTVNAYQGWLRGDVFNAASINVSNLTPFEIQLAAFTLGVRIGLLPINMNMVTKVDANGRILPEGDIFGPNTEELLLMGVWDPLDGKGGSYYSLFPKVNLDYDSNPGLYTDSEATNAAIKIENYWKSIQMKE
jgi:hypothetical protein